jgi:hypothetical protein
MDFFWTLSGPALDLSDHLAMNLVKFLRYEQKRAISSINSVDLVAPVARVLYRLAE